MKWVGKHLLSKVKNSTIQGCTSYNRGNSVLIRAHPNFKGESWYDWVIIKWELETNDGQNDLQMIPAQVVMFLYIDVDQIELDELSPNVCLTGSGLYCLVESVTDDFTFLDKKGKESIIKIGTKYDINQKSLLAKQKKTRYKNLFLVSVDSIHDTVSAIPDIGGDRGDYLFIRSADSWSEIFSDFISDFGES